MTRLSDYTSSLGFYQRHFTLLERRGTEGLPIGNLLLSPSIVAFWLDKPDWNLLAILMVASIDESTVQMVASFWEKQNSPKTSDYFYDPDWSQSWVQVWPHENEKLQKVLMDAIAMETLGGRSPVLRAY